MKAIIISSTIRESCSGLPEVGQPFQIKLSWDEESRESELEVTAELLDTLVGSNVSYAAVRVSVTDIASSIEKEMFADRISNIGFERYKTICMIQWVSTVLDKVWESRGNGDLSAVTVSINQ